MATGRPVREVVRQPAALTLWTFLQLEDLQRLERLQAKDDRHDLASLIAAAVFDARAFERARSAFVAELSRDPEPDRDRALRAALHDAYADHLRALDAFAERMAEKYPLTTGG